MMSKSRAALGACLAPLLASCVFLLDYDELQSGPSESMGEGGSGASAGSPNGTGMAGTSGGAGGEGGGACGNCDDGDPCTVDSCDESGASPECLHEPSEGLVPDGFEQVLEAEQHVRVSLVAGADVFYMAELEANELVPSLKLFRLTEDGSELEPIAEDLEAALPIQGTPASNVGLVVEPALGGLGVHGFVAIKPKLGDLPPRVFHVVNRGGKTTASLVGMSYLAENPWAFPQALAIGNDVYGAWIQQDGTISVHEVGATLQGQPFGNTTLPATTLALLSTAGNQPAVMFTAQTNDGPQGAWVETRGQNRSQISECQTAPGNYVSASVIGTQLPGLWLGNVTKAGDDYLTTNGSTLVCGENNMCAAVVDECQPSDNANSVRNVAGATVRFATDPAGVVYSVIAVPQLALKEGGADLEAKLSLALGRADFSDEGMGESTTIGGDDNGLLEVARHDTNEEVGFAGPDWPAVAILPSKRAAVAWIQLNLEGSGTELHVQRYAMCLPEE